MSGQWPPEWDDAAPGFPQEAGRHLDTDADARLSEVAAALASVPMPVLPDAFESRISAAIAAEAAARAADGAPAVQPRVIRSAGPRSHARRGRPGRPSRLVVAIGSALTCLLLAVVGYSLAGHGSSAGSEGIGAAASSGLGTKQKGPSTSRPFIATRPDLGSQPAIGAPRGFVVIESGTTYTRAMLASQVRRELASANGQRPSASPSPSAAAAGAVTPSPALAGCVLRLTGNVTPSLVDLASYDGRAAYIIAVPSRVWVVGLGCSATSQRLITSISLGGLPGLGRRGQRESTRPRIG